MEAAKEKPEYSEFNLAVLKQLRRLVKKSLVVTKLKKTVTLAAKMHGRLVVFAAFRSPYNKAADVRLYGYLPDRTQIGTVSKSYLVTEKGPGAQGQNGVYYKGHTDALV